MNEPQVAAQGLATFIRLESQARQCRDVRELAWLIVNETAQLIPYDQGVLFRIDDVTGGRIRLVAASHLLEIDPNAPAVRILEQAAAAVLTQPGATDGPMSLSLAELVSQRDWTEIMGGGNHLLWLPLIAPHGGMVAVLWLARRQTGWTEGEQAILSQLAEAFADGWHWRQPRGQGLRWRPGRSVWWAALALGALLLALPMPLSVIAPSRISAHQPEIVAAPMEGVIHQVLVQPSERVTPGQPLFEYEETDLRGARDIAQRSYQASLAEWQTTSRQAVRDDESNARMTYLKAELEVRAAQLELAETRYRMARVSARQDGIVISGRPDIWRGRPVATGERVLEIADPARVEVEVFVPVADALALHEGAEIQVFLDADPLHPLAARLTQADYEASMGPDDALAFRVVGKLMDGTPPPRIGARGSARIYSEKAPIFYHLFRRPITWVRQFFGF